MAEARKAHESALAVDQADKDMRMISGVFGYGALDDRGGVDVHDRVGHG